MKVGSLGWARRQEGPVGGRLSAFERFAFARSAIATTLTYEIGRLLRRAGLGTRRQVSLALAEIPLPATALARAAQAICEETSSPALANHCHRTYLWGSLLAARDGIAFDSELFYVASLLHDLGLTERFAPRGEVACFALAGAEAAERFALDRGCPAERSHRLAEAICRHLNARVALEEGAEAHLLRQGSGLDVVGLRLSEVAAPSRQAVLGRHPRLGLKAELSASMALDGRLHPGTRLATLCRLGFPQRVRAAPFAD